MYNDDIAIENFISYCDDMMIAEESVFATIKNGLIKLFTRLVNFLDRQVSKMKDSRIKKILKNLLERAKRGLKLSKTMKEGDEKTSQELQREAEDIQREAEEVTKDKDNNKVEYREDGKTIWYIEEPNGKKTAYREDGKTIWYIEEPNGKVTEFDKNGNELFK